MNQLDRVNRVIGFVLAVVLIAAGVYGLVRAYDGLGAPEARDPLLLGDVQDFVDRNSGWFWWVALAIAALIGYVGYRWLRAQLTPSASLRELTVARDEDGRTLLPSRAVAEAVTRDLEDDPDIRSARVRLVGSERSPALDVRAAVADAADPNRVRLRIEQEVVGRARTALERTDLEATIRLRLGDPTTRTLA